MLRVIIADDHPVVLKGLIEIICVSRRELCCLCLKGRRTGLSHRTKHIR